MCTLDGKCLAHQLRCKQRYKHTTAMYEHYAKRSHENCCYFDYALLIWSNGANKNYNPKINQSSNIIVEALYHHTFSDKSCPFIKSIQRYTLSIKVGNLETNQTEEIFVKIIICFYTWQQNKCSLCPDKGERCKLVNIVCRTFGTECGIFGTKQLVIKMWTMDTIYSIY